MATVKVPPIQGQVLHTVGDWAAYDAVAELEPTTDIEAAHIITSLCAPGLANGPAPWTEPATHKLIIDVDLPAKLIPSSTEGHFHLYIDHEIPGEKYFKLLDAMADCGLLEKGYVKVSAERGFTAVRLPWISKSDAGPTARCVACRRKASEIDEYKQLAKDYSLSSAQEAVRHEEGTYNPSNGHFYCTSCYISAGQPLGVAP